MQIRQEPEEQESNNQQPTAETPAQLSKFADDSSTSTAVRCGSPLQMQHDQAAMQQHLNTLYEWSSNNSMPFNSLKFQLIHFTLEKSAAAAALVQTTYLSNDQTVIEAVEQVNHLGVLLYHHLDWSVNIQYAKVKTWKALYMALGCLFSRVPQTTVVLWKSL